MDVTDLLRNELDRQGVRDNIVRAAIAAIVGGESGFVPRSETPYTNTRNSRIRAIFHSSLGSKPDDFINNIKRDPATFFNYVYGPESSTGQSLGNTQPGDGWKFRGRGPCQLTGRDNYQRIGAACGHSEIVANPDLVNDLAIGAAVTVCYARTRYKGGGWEGMKRAWGNSVGPVDVEKDRRFVEYQTSGQFNFTGAPEGPQTPVSPESEAADSESNDADDAAMRAVAFYTIRAIQLVLAGAGFYHGKIDADFGKGSRDALNSLLDTVNQAESR